MHDIVNHGREMGWDNVSSETRNTGRNVRQVKQTPQNDSRELKTIDRQSRAQEERNELWKQALAMDIPRVAIHRQPAGVILSLTEAFQEQDVALSPATFPPQSTPKELPNSYFHLRKELQEQKPKNSLTPEGYWACLSKKSMFING
ncbi:hypothetical protein GRJ2_003381800 [Grus japonensis]|uniref:Uncharacterized protein n=1 Tax=Grus japonensis TaxID=30415 RepID=A0ABC9YHV6_GRUJA